VKSSWIKITETREAYVSLEAEHEAEARAGVFEMDAETFVWERDGIDIASIDEQEADEPST
jgi:hypothetical protein